VSLSAPNKAVHDDIASPEADAVAQALRAVINAVPPLTPVRFESEGRPHRAVALPSEETQDVGICELAENDLMVPVEGGTVLYLTRRFRSFCQPRNDYFDQAWTLDLPTLLTVRLPLRRDEERATFTEIFHLTSPLGTVAANFTKRRFVPEANGELLVTPVSSSWLGVADANEEKIGFPTRVALHRDGRRWHFDTNGALAAIESAPLTVVYRRDAVGRVRRIEGWYGGQQRAGIDLEYNPLGRLVRANGSNGAMANYAYDAAGALIGVRSPNGLRAYQYREGLVTRVSNNGAVWHEFNYDRQGRLERERGPNGIWTTYQIKSAAGLQSITASRDGQISTEEALYDSGMQPVSRVLANGTRTKWKRETNGAEQEKTISPQGKEWLVRRDASRKTERWSDPDGTEIVAEYDDAQRLTSLKRNSQPMLRQQWRPDGQIAALITDTLAWHRQYSVDGVPSGWLLTPPTEAKQYSQWMKVSQDSLGRVEGVFDHSGTHIQITYDKAGEPVKLTSPQGGLEIQRDAKGRVLQVRSSWDRHLEATYAGDALSRIALTHGGNQATLEYEHGNPTLLRQFDGGTWTRSYDSSGSRNGPIREIVTPNGFTLDYQYDSEGRLKEVTCGSTYKLELSYNQSGSLASLIQTPSRTDKVREE